MKNDTTDDHKHYEVLVEMVEEAFTDYDKWAIRGDLVKLQASYAMSIYNAITDPKIKAKATQKIQSHQRFFTQCLNFITHE